MIGVRAFAAVTSACLFLFLVVTSSLAQSPTDNADGELYSHNDTTTLQNGYRHIVEDPTLLLVQVIFRHGDRSPLGSFPTDSHQDGWSQGYGQLTELGMTQGYEFGKFLGSHYLNFLGQSYKPEEVHIQSSDKDRTLMTAQCVAAGLFPRQTTSVKKVQSVQWQPVPVHTMPRKQDKTLSPDKACTYVRELKYGLKAYFYSQQDIMKDKGMMFALSRYSGLVMNFTTLYNLADTLFCQKVHNMTLPTWFDATTESKLFSFYHRLPVLMREEAKYLAGILLESLIGNMGSKAGNPLDKHKLYLYSAHQGNLHSLMSLLGVFNKDTNIPYASAVIMELHRVDNKLFVKLLYKTGDASSPKILRLPGCKSDFCPLSALNDIWEEPAHKAWQDVCGQASHENVIDFGENTIPILVAVLVVFICLDLFLLYKTFKYRQRLINRDGKEAYALVRTDAGSSSGSDNDGNDDDDDDDIDDTKGLLNKDHSDLKRHHRHRQQHIGHVMNGGERVNGTRGKGKRSNGRGIDNSESYEETALFVAPSRPPK